MGGSSKQTTGYKYFSNFLLFIGNPIEKVLGINFDKRGWQAPLIDDMENPLVIGDVYLPHLYGENEGGVVGEIHARYGTENPDPVDFYSSYLAENDLPPLSYPYQSYLAFKDFYLGNSGYMKEMLLWPKRIHVKNNGDVQWYDGRAEIRNIDKIYVSSGIDTPFDSQCILEIENLSTPLAIRYRPNTSKYLLQSQSLTSVQEGEIPENTPDKELKINLYIPTELIVVHEFDLSVSSADFGLSFYVEPIELSVNYIYTDITGRNHYKVKATQIVTNVDIGFTLKSSGRKKNEVSGSWMHGFSINDYSIYAIPEFKTYVDTEDMNPVHKIREILTDDTAMNKPESDVNDANFMKAADRIYEERLGISWAITEKSCLEAIEELCGHIEAGVRVNRQTGLYEMVLFRDDWFEESEIYTLPVNKIKSMSLEVANADEAINQLNVTYYNRAVIKDSSFSIAENASIRNLNGRVNAEDADFPYFMNQRNAAIVAQWKVKQMSSPVWKGSFTTAEYNARKWNRYDLLKLAWPKKWQGTITVRIMKINLGMGTDVSIDFVEVTPYSSNLSSDIVIDEPIDLGVQPPLACPYEPFEMPYYLAVMALGQRQVDEELSYESNLGLVGVVAGQPQSNSLYAVMMTHDGTEGEEWVRAATINYEPVADLDQIISRTSISFTVKDSTVIAELPIGTLIKCGSDWIGTPGEWMVFQGIDAYTGVVSVKRGALDSLPQDWGIDTKLYFCGNDVAYDQTEYVSGEEVLVSALTTTPSGMLENRGSIAIEMNARAIRPYPPANVKINGKYWPTYFEDDLVITWVDRNRLQQTGGSILGWFDGGVTLEPDTQTMLTITEYDANNIELSTQSANVTEVNTFTLLESGMSAGVRKIEITLKTVRDGYECLNPFTHSILISNLIAPSNVAFEVIEL